MVCKRGKEIKVLKMPEIWASGDLANMGKW